MRAHDFIEGLRAIIARVREWLATIATGRLPLSHGADLKALQPALNSVEAKLAAIEAAVAAGVNDVEVAGERIAFASTRELLQERDRLLRQLSNQAGE